MLISVIIPCRNEEKYIKNCLLSLSNQSINQNFYEIIVVDGKSEDNTINIINEIAREYNNIKVINNEKKITPVAFNLGIKEAKGKIIAICGAHAIYSTNYLEEGLRLFELVEDADCVGGPIISKGENNFAEATALAMSSKVGIGNANHRFPDYEGYAEMACFPFFKREVFNKIGLYDESLIRNQDDEFCFRLRTKGGKVYISPKVKSTYLVRNSPKKLFRQYFLYGFYRWHVFKKYSMPISLRHFIPSFFIITILLLLMLGLLIKNFSFLLVLLLVYVLVIFSVSLMQLKKYGLIISLLFNVSVYTLHFSYGSGLIYSLINEVINKKK